MPDRQSGFDVNRELLEMVDALNHTASTPMVALLASLFGASQSPRQQRSSIVSESAPTSSHFSPISSLTRSPVQTATNTMLA